jgi:catechol 2,3-dioxygenase-like lactoylglutathione lyase family enzyme
MNLVSKSALLIAAIGIGLYLVLQPTSLIDVDKTATVADTSTSVIGLNHIGLSVRDLDAALAFYQGATQFELLRRESVSVNEQASKLFGQDDIAYEIAVLRGPNMLLELTQFEGNQGIPVRNMPPKGPGMTHTCFQSPGYDSGWDKFVAMGIDPLSRGDQPIDLGGYGITYGYAHDPDGNMIELEQLDGSLLERAGYGASERDLGGNLWMSQVGLATHDIAGLMEFYQMVLGFKPYRYAHVTDNPRLDDIVDIDNVDLIGGWFKLNQASKVIEIWQYVSPETPEFTGQRAVTALGYSFSIEVADIQVEYRRLTELGLDFVSEPVELDGFWQVYSRDLDGNIFSLRQAIDPQSRLSVRKLDAWPAR